MGDREEDMQQMTMGRIQTRIVAFRTEPIWNALGEQPGCPDVPVFRENVAAVIGERAAVFFFSE